MVASAHFFCLRVSKYMQVILSVVALYVGLPVVTGQDVTKFSITQFNDSSSLFFQGDCATKDGVLLMDVNTSDPGLSPATYMLSRAVYNGTVKIYNSSTSMQNSFNTSFTFQIQSVTNHTPGDGLAFTLSPSATLDNRHSAWGLYDASIYSDGDPRIQAVAIVFDTVQNKVEYGVNRLCDDPKGLCVPNTTVSTTLNHDFHIELTDATQTQAWIDYDASAGNWDVYIAQGNKRNKSLAYHVLWRRNDSIFGRVAENSYVGFVSRSGDYFAGNNIYQWEFATYTSTNATNTTNGNIGATSPAPAEGPLQAAPNDDVGFEAGIAVEAAVALVTSTLAVLCCWRCIKLKSNNVSQETLNRNFLMSSASWPNLHQGLQRYTLSELRLATHEFSDVNKLGQGGSGTVYRGVLQVGNIEVAIKRITRSDDSKEGEREFQAELLSIGHLRHRNLVCLRGWCHENGELLLVYDYMQSGSLDQHLYSESDSSLLSWQHRFDILQGVATALVYIHSGWDECVLHRDIKPANVLLDSKMTARLGDFGLALIVSHRCNKDSSTGTDVTKVAGTKGYFAPEYVITGRATTKSDIYSFGMLALEVVCRRRPRLPVESHDECHDCLVEWVRNMHERGELLAVVDPSLQDDTFLDVQDQITRVLHLGLLCTLEIPSRRPSTQRLPQALSGDWSLPPVPCFGDESLYLGSKNSHELDSQSTTKEMTESVTR